MSRRNLSEDMEIDILLRLPVKSLLRFRCVSKPWCTRFQNPLFIANHYLKQTSLHNTNNYDNVSVLVHRLDEQFLPRLAPPYFTLLDQKLSVKENIQIPLPKNSLLYPKIMGPCNGLVCLWNQNHYQITLWNPATREFKHLPVKSRIQRPPIPYLISHHLGFGFDSKTNDYKVIFTFYTNYDNNIKQKVHLYTLSTDSWREIHTEYHICNTPHFNTYINGVYHWEARVAKYIICFDMADEVFSTLPLPSNISFDYKFWDLGILNGSLAVINFDPNMGMYKSFDLWVMKEYGVKESWIKQLTIGSIFGVHKPLGFWKNGGLFLQSIEDKQLVLYDTNTREIEKLQVHSRQLTMRVVVYVESLVSINGRREHDDEYFVRLPTQMENA